jgi:hypothetical protein
MHGLYGLHPGSNKCSDHGKEVAVSVLVDFSQVVDVYRASDTHTLAAVVTQLLPYDNNPST